MKLFVSLFAALGIPFGLFMGAMEGFDHGFEAGLRIGVFQGLFFGCVMALFLTALQRRECRKLGADVDLSPAQSVSLEVSAESPQAVFARVKKAVDSFGANIVEQDEENTQLRAKVRSSWKSMGEILECRVLTAGTHRFEIEIVSRPRFRGTLIDYGKGRQNVENVMQRLG